ncbi:MAG: tryptophan 7-halogenase [Pleurocapsa sp.]
MKVAVIGGGSAGFLAAAHLTKKFPQFELFHIYDSRIPIIGVGEGTLPAFRPWLQELTGLNFKQLVEKCHITRKFGIHFENWGKKRQQFMHNFLPVGLDHGIHFSAPTIVELLKNYVRGIHLDKRVIALKSDGRSALIEFEDETELEVDFVFDASGFPKKMDEGYLQVPLIPTNSATIRRGPVSDYQVATRTIARPHGWMFVIPLTTHTSYGYIYNSSISSQREIEEDFDAFMAAEDITRIKGIEKHLSFPSFTCVEPFDGVVFKIGNAAGFLEPLEATALQVLQHQIAVATSFPLNYLARLEQSTNLQQRIKLNQGHIDRVNKHLVKYVLQIALFLSWHYVEGSCFDTEFWRFAQSNFQEGIENFPQPDMIEHFQKYVMAGSKFLNTLDFPQRVEMRETATGGIMPRNFGGYSEESFAEVGTGIGYF